MVKMMVLTNWNLMVVLDLRQMLTTMMMSTLRILVRSESKTSCS